MPLVKDKTDPFPHPPPNLDARTHARTEGEEPRDDLLELRDGRLHPPGRGDKGPQGQSKHDQDGGPQGEEGEGAEGGDGRGEGGSGEAPVCVVWGGVWLIGKMSGAHGTARIKIVSRSKKVEPFIHLPICITHWFRRRWTK